MHFTRSFVVFATTATALLAPSLAEAQAPPLPCGTIGQCNEHPALHQFTTQTITYTIARQLVGSSFIHGPATTVYVSRKGTSKGLQTQVDSDCAGAAAAGLPQPKYAIRRYMPRMAVNSTCLAPGEVTDSPPGYDGPAYRRGIRVRRVKALKSGWRFVNQLTSTIDECRHRHASVPWRHLSSIDSNMYRTVLHYHPRHHTVRDIRQVVFMANGGSDWRVTVTYGNGAQLTCSDTPGV